MKKTSKLAVFFLFFIAMAIGAMKLTATAAIPVGNVSVDYFKETVTVDAGLNSDTIIYFTETYNKDISKWDACEVRNGKAVFDISWINQKKTVRLYLCGDVNTDVIAVDIAWEENFNVDFTGTLLSTDITEASRWKEEYKYYPAFSEDTGYFIFTMEENGREMSYFELDSIEWRKGDDGIWRNFAELDLKEMNIRGIDLQFRIVANADDRASSIAKIVVSKLNSAPSVQANPDTMMISLKNGMEFSFDKKDWILIPEYNKKFGENDYFVEKTDRENAIEKIYTNQRISGVLIQDVLKSRAQGFTTNTPMSKDSLTKDYANTFEFTEEGIVLYVREAGTERRAASKIGKVIIPYAPDDMAVAEADALAFSYGDSKTNTGGIVVENKSTYKYQVGVITAEEWDKILDKQDIDLSGMKWTSIKGEKMLKISNKKVPKGSYLVYRIAGENGQLPSTYQFYGPMEYNELTYAGIAPGTLAAGEKLEAQVSTNLELTDNRLAFQWQRCKDVKAEQPEWTDITGATQSSYEMTNEDAQCYIRVRITNQVQVGGVPKEIVMFSDYKGPVKYVAPAGSGTEGTEGQ